MNTKLRWMAKCFITLVITMGIYTVSSRAQQQIGGPYEVDSSTVLLMHFNENLTNVSDSSQDGVAHGTIQYIEEAPLDTLGQAARILNASVTDSSFITVPHTEALTLTESWTIEGWVNIFTFGESSDSYKWVPRLIVKPGEEQFFYGNYYLEIWGNSRHFKAGYHTRAGADPDWIEVDSPVNLMEPGFWYHWAYIRDAENDVLISIVHRIDNEGNMERVFFGVNPYDPISESPPLTNENDVHIGFAGGGGDSFLDGFVDEIRVSNIVRNFEIPPVYTSYTNLDNQQTGSDYQISASVYKLGQNHEVDQVKAHYRANGGDFQEITLSSEGNRTYSGTIPEQSVGSTIDYYYSATGTDGMTSYYPNTALQDSTYFTFGVVDPQSEVLNLAFEEGSGIPIDSSAYNNSVSLVGNTTYSDDARSGNYSLELDGDSSFVMSESAFYSNTEMQVEMWFKPDSVQANETRLAIKAGSPWWESNFEIKFRGAGIMSGGSFVPSITEPTPFIMDEMVLDSSATPNEWNKIIYQVDNDTAIVQLFDENEQFVDEAIFQLGEDNDPVLTQSPLYIGGLAVNSPPPYFDGKIDDFRMYNYAKDDLEIHTAIDKKTTELPRNVYLGENYPNPFNPATNIHFNLPTSQQVTLTVYDVLGRKVATLVDGVKQAGRHQVTFEASGMSSGVYMYKLQTQQQTLTKKMLLVK